MNFSLRMIALFLKCHHLTYILYSIIYPKYGTCSHLGIFEHEEEVHVPNENADELHHASSGDDHVEAEQHPGKIHRLELSAEPEVDDGVLVQLTPDVEDAHDHGIHDEGNGHEECHDHRQEPVEEKHEEVVCGAPIKDARF